MKRTVGRKLILLFLGFCALPLLALGLISHASSIRAVREMLIQQTAQDVGRLAMGIAEGLATLKREVSNIAALGFARENLALRRVLESRTSGELYLDARLILDFVQLKSRVSQLILVDPSGAPLVRLHGMAVTGSGELSFNQLETENFGEVDTVGVELARTLRAGEAELLRLGPPDGVTRIRGATPVFLPGQEVPTAFLLVDAELMRLADRVAAEVLPVPASDPEARFSAFVLDIETGAFLHHRDPTLLQQAVVLTAPSLWEAFTRGSNELGRVVGAARAGALARKPLRPEAVARDLAGSVVSGTHAGGTTGEVMVHSGLVLPELGLLVGVVAPSSRFVQPFLHAARLTLAATATVLAVSALLLTLFSRSFRHSVRELTRGSEALARGEFGHRVGVSSGDEMEELAGAFNQMAADLDRMTREREEAARFESLSRLVSVVLHDLKGLVFNLSLLAENLSRRGEDRRFQAEAVATLNRLADRMKHLVVRLPAVVNQDPSAGARSLVDLRTLASEVVEELGISGRHELEVMCAMPGQPVELELDAEGIRRAIRNILTNAIEAMPGGGRLTVGLHVRAGDRAPAGGNLGAGHTAAAVELRIGDTGHGIPDSLLAQGIFRPFQTTKERGLGLGLYSAREVVRAHGGEIRVESAEGKGTIFTLVFPVTGAARGAAAEEVSA